MKCSSRLESSVPGVYAAGDICEYDSVIHGRHLRVEHWDVAFNQGKTAALNMLGRDVPHDTVPYFFSDLADWSSMEYVGPGSGEPVIRGSLEDGDFTAFYVDDGQGDGGAHGRPLGRPGATRGDGSRRGRGRTRSGWRTSRRTWRSSEFRRYRCDPFGGSSNGKTPGSGPGNRGSSPCPPVASLGRVRACRKLPVIVIALIAFAGCGDDDEGRVEQSGDSTATSTSATSTGKPFQRRKTARRARTGTAATSGPSGDRTASARRAYNP